MKIEDIITLIATNTQLVICKSNGKVYYTGNTLGAYTFGEFEIEKINIINNQLIMTISTNDMLD